MHQQDPGNMTSSPLGVYIGNATGEEHIVEEDVKEFNDPQELLVVVVHTSLSMDTAAWHTDMWSGDTTARTETASSASSLSGMGKYDTQNFELAIGKENSGRRPCQELPCRST
jgi:hypothetical protein